MTISPFLIYLWQLADEMKGVCAIAATVLFVASIITLVCTCGPHYGKEDEESALGMRKWLGRKVWIPSLLAILAVLLPSSKTIAMMVIIPSIANSSVIQKDVPELYKFAVDALKSQLQEAAK